MSGAGLTIRASRAIKKFGPAALVVAVLVSMLAGLEAAPTPASAADVTPALRGDLGSGWIPDVPAVAIFTQVEIRPAITTAANGDLYMAFETGVSGSRDIYFTWSSDAGMTWVNPVAVAARPADEVNPSIATDPYSGRVFVAYQEGTSGATPIHVAYADAVDLYTWTDRFAVQCVVLCEKPRIVSEYWNGTNNRVYVAFAGELGATNWDVVVATSADHGGTWTWYESGITTADIRYQPDIAAHRGTDGVDRVFVFYRGGAAFPGTSGYLEWSSDHGRTWAPRVACCVNVYSPVSIVAANNGRSLLLAYSTNTPQIVWVQFPYPQNLALLNYTWAFLPTGGTNPSLAVDGVGTTDATIGGNYHMIARDSAGNQLFWTTAPVTLTTNADWSATQPFDDSGAMPSITYPERGLTVQRRTGTWYPAAAWADFRAGLPDYDIYYATPGAHVFVDTVPSGLTISFGALTRTAPYTFGAPAGQKITVGTLSPQSGGPGVRYVWASWSDGGGIGHTNTWYTTDDSLTATFDAEYQVAINSSPSGRSVSLDNVTQTTPASFWATGGIHTVSVSSPQAGAPGWQYIFASWSDGGAATHAINVIAPATLQVDFTTQVQLTLSSVHGGVSGGGWYDLGLSPTILATGPQPGGAGTRYVFSGWAGDLTSTANPTSVLMDAPKTVIAVWDTEYLLTVNTTHGNASGAGWKAAGSTVQVRVLATEVVEGDKTWQFTGWSGGATGTAATINVTMTGPKTLTANWQEKPAGLLAGGTGLLVLLALVAALVVALLLAGFVLRRRRKKEPAFGQMQPIGGIGTTMSAPPGQGAPPPAAPPPPPWGPPPGTPP